MLVWIPPAVLVERAPITVLVAVREIAKPPSEHIVELTVDEEDNEASVIIITNLPCGSSVEGDLRCVCRVSFVEERAGVASLTGGGAKEVLVREGGCRLV